MAEPTRILFISAIQEGHEFLPKVNEELNTIREGIFEGINAAQQEYVTDVYQYIDKNFVTKITAWQPDIVHFTGHGKNDGLLLQKGDRLSGKQLKDLLINQEKTIQLLFLNACDSADLIPELKESNKVQYIIGNEGEISEDIATDFACIFYKYYKRVKNIPEAFDKARFEYKWNNPRAENFKQVFHPPEKVDELTHSETPIDRAIKQYQVKVIQSKQIPSDLLSKIQNTISAFDEDIMISQDSVKFKTEMKNVSDILSTLMVHAQEYAVNIDGRKLKEQNLAVTQMIKELDDEELPRKGSKTIENVQAIYQKIIIDIFKKIHFNLVLDSIEKLSPLLPEDSEYELFVSILGIMNSVLKSFSLIREKLNQSFEADSKFYKDYLINRCVNLITYITLDFKDLIELLKSQMQPDLYRINFHDDMFHEENNIRPKLDEFNGLLIKTREEKDESGRIRALKEDLENLSNMEDLIVNLFRTIVLTGLEHKRKNSHSNIVPNLSEEDNARDTQFDTKMSYKEIDILEDELMENADSAKPRDLLSTITELTGKIIKEYEDYCSNDRYADKDIRLCYDKMYRRLQNVRDDMSKNIAQDFEKFKMYPYLYPEIEELCYFWGFRLNALERKQARKYLVKINYYFSNQMYEKVSQSSDMKRNDTNIRLFNVKLLNKIGVANMHLGKYSEAKDKFNKILSIDKLNTDALFNLGLTYQELEGKDPDRKYTKSIEQFDKIIREDPNHVNAWTSLGILKFKIRKYDEAFEAIKKAIKLGERDDWRALLAMGCVLSDYRKHFSAAKEYFDACESLNPTSILVNLNKSQNLILLKEYVAGEKLLIKILNKIEAIEDRSTKIITIILLICLRYLNKDEANPHNETLIKDLLRLFQLKDSKLVDWNFQNLNEAVKTAENSKDIKSEDAGFLTNLLSIPGSKPKDESESLKKKIGDFVTKSKPDSKNINYISDDDERIKVHVEIKERLGKSQLYEIEWFLWNISLELSPEFLNDESDESVDYVVYMFDPTFQDKREDKKLYRKDGKATFSINVIGWEDSKFEIELHHKDGSILKKVSNLRE
jgi:tetratricopeptide (TPR) repeat protein